MPNRLANASSPYLRQHAANPVDWQPWDDATLNHAREADTPILLSIGYSACHWCHVMAHECFEKPAIAGAMNTRFVNIKLDREERPDIDHVYQLAHQAMSGRGGGWPLTAFLDPQDLTPFFIGTYFPPTARHGLPGFPEVLARVRDYFDSHRDELRAQSSELRTWLQRAETGGAGARPDSATAASKALQRITSRFDSDWGGNRGAPKFPRGAELEWLLTLIGQPDAHDMARQTLRMMAMRGLQDHLGGGFFRYCVDANWTIPHFEKMLYDNAQLLAPYAQASREDGNKQAGQPAATDAVNADLRAVASNAANGIIAWLQREMTAPNDAFYSSLDADSEGDEGRFYLWTCEQVHAVLRSGDSKMIDAAFGLDHPPNFEGRAWHLMRTVSVADLASRFDLAPTAIAKQIIEARQQLFDAREQRVRPGRDDKILTTWNALMISGLARSARLLDESRCADMATRALSALRESAWINGKLFANIAQPPDRIPGFLDDHALLLDALLETMQLAFDPRDLDWAMALADTLLVQFQDHDNGGFWFSTTQHATPLARGRSFTDDALPNGNGMAVLALLRLGHLLGNTDYLDAAERALDAAAGALAQYPDACPTLLRTLNEHDHPRTQIVVRCSREQESSWRTALRFANPESGDSARDVFVIPSELDGLPGALASRVSNHDQGTAWICEGMTCRAPVNSPSELADALSAHASSGLRP